MVNLPDTKIRLTADNAQIADEGRCIVRVDPEYLSILKVDVGDVIYIQGERASCARVMILPAQLRGRKLIQMDRMTMQNASVKRGDEVEVARAVFHRCTRAILTCVGNLPKNTRWSDPEYMGRLLSKHCICKGDHILLRLPGEDRVEYAVAAVYPEGFTVIDEFTRIIVSNVKSGSDEESYIGYKDVGGLDKQITRIKEIVEYPLKYRGLFHVLGLEPARGILLYGPPGTGKTLIAKAIANEVNAKFITISGPEVINKYYGESEARIRGIFEEAEKNTPSIIFIDEIDAIAPKREEVQGDVEKRIVAQLLSLMDGMKDRAGVVVIGATNLPNSLDPALRRPGRFDREIYIGVPDEASRADILKIHMRKVPLAEDVDLSRLAHVTHGYVGADLSSLCREASMNCIRRHLAEGRVDMEGNATKPETVRVSQVDFMQAFHEIQPSAIRDVTAELACVTWNMIGGLCGVKARLKECIEWPLKYPSIYSSMCIKNPRGILLYGPTGTGKTLVAKAVASESGAGFIPVKGPELLSKWQGETEKGIREIFRKARMMAPCIIFFDEIDSFASVGQNNGRENSSILAQLLTEMDGISAFSNVIVIGATNHIEALDKSLLRDGRFDELLEFKLPDRVDRKMIFELHLSNRRLEHNVDIERLSLLSEGCSGAEIEGICRRAAMQTVRRYLEKNETGEYTDSLKIGMEDLESAITEKKGGLYE